MFATLVSVKAKQDNYAIPYLLCESSHFDFLFVILSLQPSAFLLPLLLRAALFTSRSISAALGDLGLLPTDQSSYTEADLGDVFSSLFCLLTDFCAF
jgi:hypothetical protein